jgi:hypothetical protein
MFYDMSYRLGCTEDDTDVNKAVEETQEYHNAQDKREWVGWAGKVLMLQLHAQIAMEKADVARAEQEVLEFNGPFCVHSFLYLLHLDLSLHNHFPF